MRPGLANMAEWIEAQRRAGTFRGPVCGPLALEMTLLDAISHARPVEAVRRGA